MIRNLTLLALTLALTAGVLVGTEQAAEAADANRIHMAKEINDATWETEARRLPWGGWNCFDDTGALPQSTREAICRLKAAGITEGCRTTDGFYGADYCPYSKLRRDQMATFLTRWGRWLGSNTSGYWDWHNPPVTHFFSDVSSSNYHRYSIAEIADNGITNGCAYRRYCPGGLVSTSQIDPYNRNGSFTYRMHRKF